MTDQTVSVTADTSQAVTALGDLPQASDQTITVVADITQAQSDLSDLSDKPNLSDKCFTVNADVSAAQSSLLQVTSDAEKLNGTVAKVPVEGFVAKFKKGLAAVRAELNKTAGGAGKFLETFLAGGGGIGIIMAGVASVGKIVQTVYNNWRQKLAENADLHNRNAASIRESAEANEQLRQKSSGYLDQLQSMASQEQLSNASKAEALKLISELSKGYGDLGISIDAATGKLTGLDEAMVKKAETDKARRIAELQAELKQIQSESAQQRDIRDSAGIPVWFDGDTRVGGEEETKAAGQKLEELAKRASEVRKQLAQIRKEDPREAMRKKQQGEIADLKQHLAEQQRITSDTSELSNISDDAGKIAHLQKAKDRHQQEILAPLQEQISHAARRAATATDVDKLEAEKQLLQLKITQQKELQKAYALEKQIKEVKAQQASAAKAQSAATLQQAENLKKQLADQAFSLYGQAMGQSGQGRVFAEQSALRDARKTKGADLTAEESELVKKLAGLSFNLSEGQKGSPADLSVKTNALTARGGFQGGAVVPSAEKYNREILQTNKNTLSTLKQIQKLCENLGTF